MDLLTVAEKYALAYVAMRCENVDNVDILSTKDIPGVGVLINECEHGRLCTPCESRYVRNMRYFTAQKNSAYIDLINPSRGQVRLQDFFQ